MLNIANTLADIAADIARSYFRREISLSLKKGIYPVTQVDLEIEMALRQYLNKTLPDHGILGEEYDFKSTNSEYIWVIDPIDGTISFTTGKPTFCTLIALLKDDKPLFGIIDQPISKERWVGNLAQQSSLNGIPCHTNVNYSPDFIKLSCTTPEMFVSKTQIKKFESIRKLASVVSYGGDAYSYGLLASGLIDVIFEADLQYYDIAALIPIIEGSGGMITDWNGNLPNRHNFNGTILATANKKLHDQILELIRENYYDN